MGGSNGEGPYLKAEEKIEMVSKIRSMIGKDKLLIAGTTCECNMKKYITYYNDKIFYSDSR